MILTIDIGNTTVSLGGVDASSEQMGFTARLETDSTWSGIDYGRRIMELLRKRGFSAKDFEGTVISSVVPTVAAAVAEGIRLVMGKAPMLVTAQTNTGLTVSLPQPDKIGRDRLVDAAWAAAHLPLPLVTADLGTATTLNVVQRGRVFCGGVIAAGLSTGLRALAERAAQLPQLELATPQRVIGTNTEESMLSGAVVGAAAMLDGLVSRIEEELGEPVSLAITGGTAKYVESLVRHPHIYDPDLTLKGLALLYRINQP